MKRRLIRYAILAGGGALLLIAILAVIFLRRPQTLQDWIGGELQDIANGYLNPQLSFSDLSYQYPLTVSLKNLRLTASDPANPGHTIDIIACEQARVSLAEIPSVGKPIVIQEISLTEPLISAVAVAPGSKKFVGLDDLVRGGSTSSSESAPTSKPPPKLSDVFRMRLVQIINGRIVYNPRIPGTVPMQLDKINTVLNIQPAEAGWYKLDTGISRDPVFHLQVKGALSLDSFSVKDVDINLLADLGRDKLDYLPPELQALLKQYEARGKLQVEVKGSMPLTDPLSGQAEVSASLGGANLALHGLRIPVEKFELETKYADSKVTLSKLWIESLGGAADLSGSLVLNDRLDAALHLNIAGMVPEKLLANAANMSPYPARLDLDLKVATSLKSVLGRAPPIPDKPLASVSLTNLEVSADDPVAHNKRLDVVACKNLETEMSRPIQPGEPIVIDKIAVDRPVISVVAISPGELQFVGVPNLPVSSTPAPATSPAASQPAPESTGKPSGLFRVKSFVMNNARITYDLLIPGTQRMCLDPINATINIDPQNPGGYQIAAEIARKPDFDLGIHGKVDIDNPALQNVNLDLHADLTGENLDFLPPQLQLILRKTKARAKVDFHGVGSVALSNLSHASAQIETEIQNIELNPGNRHIPIKDLALFAKLQDGKISEQMRINTLNNNFTLRGTVTLNRRRDVDAELLLRDIKLEPLLAALDPDKPRLDSSTTLNADIRVKTPLMVALGAFPERNDEPVVSLDIRDVRLTTDDPLDLGQSLDFFACDDFAANVLHLPLDGKALLVDHVNIDHPAIRAIATTQQSKDFAGFAALQNMAASQAPPATAPSETSTSTQPSTPATDIGDLVRVQKLAMTDAAVYYDPRIDSENDPNHPTVPMSLDHIAMNARLDSLSGDAYRFDAVIPSKPNFNLDVGGRINLETLVISPLSVDLFAYLASENPKYLPPQVQSLIPPYSPVGKLSLKASGDVPLRDPMAAELNTDLKLDNFAATFGSWRIPAKHLRLPLHLNRHEVDFLDPTRLGGPDIEAFGGALSLTGSLMLNNRLDSTLSIHIDGMTLQDLMACKTTGPKSSLIGTVQADVELVQAPIILVANDATPPPPPPPPAPGAPPPPPPPEPPVADATTQPTYASDLPDNWGNAQIDLTNARLAGLEVIQGMGNIAKSAFANIIQHKKNETETVVPKENAHLVFTFDKDRLDFSQIHYEGEIMAADGKGWVSFEQQMNLVLTGGLMQKLGGLGGFGNWVKQASDSLLYYHVYGSVGNIQYKVHRGNGEPIVQGVKKGAEEGGKYIGIGLNKAGQGLNQAGKFFNGLFHKHKDSDQPQTQPSDQGQ